MLFILSAANGKMTVAGEKSSADAMIALAGGVNAISGFDGYKPASAEALVAASPDAIVMMSNRTAADAAEQVLATASLAGSPAVAQNRIELMEGTYLLGFGPRLARAARDLADFLHPELKLAERLRSERTRPWREPGARRIRRPQPLGRLALPILLAALLVCFLASLMTGPVPLSIGAVIAGLFARTATASIRDIAIVRDIRLPRTLLALLVGAALAVSGAFMQGLFRNPLADPGLAGVSSGASLAAVTTIVLGHYWIGHLPGLLQPYALAIAAFLGGLISTLLLYAIATRNGTTSVATLLLGGIALAALAGARSAFSSSSATISNCAISPSGILAASAAPTGPKILRSAPSSSYSWP